MSTSPVIQSGVEIAEHRSGGAGDAWLLIAVGIGGLLIRSMSAGRAVRRSTVTVPSSQTCSGGRYRRQRRTSRTLLPVDHGRAMTAVVYRSDSQPKSVWRARGPRCPSTLIERWSRSRCRASPSPRRFAGTGCCSLGLVVGCYSRDEGRGEGLVVEFRILGPLEVVRDGESVVLGGAQQRALLAVLVLHRGEMVSIDRLVDELWGERASATAAKTVHVYVSRLRKQLGSDVIATHGRGYRLAVEPERVDVAQFDALCVEGRRALAEGDAARARE